VGEPLAEKGNSSTMPNVLIDSDGKLFKGDIGGTSGEKGAQGLDGEKGATGAGEKGFQGDKGQKGQQGEIGVGTKGDKGETGVGEKGSQGETGEKGATGAGEKGATGAGEKGETGVGEKGSQGETGEKGQTGAGDKGETGVGEKGSQGETGEKGAQGETGEKGQTGAGEKGETGVGEKGSQGETGEKGQIGAGEKGETGTGDKGADGLAATVAVGTTTTGVANVVNSGTTLAAIFDFTVPQGEKGEAGAGGGSAIILNNNLHYNVLTIGSDLEVYVKGSGNYMGGITWARSTTTLTVNQTAHGLSTGNVVMIRNMSEDYLHGAITVVNTDQFTIDCANSGDTSGTAGAYIPAFSASAVQSSGDVSSITITGCSGAISGSQQIDGVHFYANNQNSSPIALTIPAGLQNGGGANGNKKQITVPLITGTAAGTGTNGSPFSSLKVSSFLSATQNKYNLTGTDEQFGPSLFNVVF